MRRSVVVPAIAIVWVSACSLTTDLDGFSGGPADAAPPSESGQVIGQDGAPIGPSGDAGTDAPPLSEAGACPQKPVVVCEEFLTDEKANGWQVVQINGGTLSLMPGTELGERGLIATIPETTTGDPPAAYWQKSFPQVVSKLSFDADIGYDKNPVNQGEYHILFEVRIDHGATWNLFYLGVPTVSNAWALQDFPAHDGDIDYRVVNIVPGVRHHVHWDVAVGDRSRFALDGNVLLDNSTPSFVQAGTPTLYLGVVGSGIPATPINFGIGHLVFTGE